MLSLEENVRLGVTVNDLPLIVIGGGGHGRVVIDTLRAMGVDILGIVERDPAAYGESGPFGLTVLGNDDALDDYDTEAVLLANGVGGTGDTGPRGEIYRRLTAHGFRFATVVHPSAVLGGDVALGDGAQVMAGAVVQPGAVIGENAIANTGARIDHDCRIGAHAHIAPGAVLSGNVTVGEGAHVGAGAVVRQGLCIGEGALVALGAAVIADVAAGGRVGGVPAREMPR